jgi:hypothetical protein
MVNVSVTVSGSDQRAVIRPSALGCRRPVRSAPPARPPRALGWAAEEVRITRKTLMELPDPRPPAPPSPKLPGHPAYQQIMAVFAAADTPLRARQGCEAMDLEIAPDNIN